MNLKTLRDTTLATVGKDTELQVAELNIFINEGKSMIESKILDEKKDFFPDTELITVTPGQITVTPTKTWLGITLVQVDFGNGFQTLNNANLQAVLGPNSTDIRGDLIFHLWGDVIHIPNFGKALTMRLYGYIVPADLVTDDDEPVFSKLLHPLIATWAIGRAIETDTANESYLDGVRKRTEFWEELDIILPTIVHKDSTNVRSLI